MLVIEGGGRLAFGCAVLIYLTVYNELSASCIIFSTMFSFTFCILSGKFKAAERSLPISYIRASNRFDFTCLFLSTWLETLAILCACVILARTISVCFDVMTGGLARISILGRNAHENEPWPDVLGVGVVFLFTTMFMLGLEHSLAFSGIMIFGVCGLTFLLCLIAWWNGNTTQWVEHIFLPNGSKNFFRTSALLGFAFSSEMFIQSSLRLSKFFQWTCVTCFLTITTLSISSLVQNRLPEEYIAVPLFNIIIENKCNKLLPVAACLLLLTAIGAFLELFPELYGMIVKLSTSDWKILSKQIRYESVSSGNPVLAVFIAGSLCAMLVFSCPLQNLCYTLAASHLSADSLRIFYFFYVPFRPTFIEQNNVESALKYSRLTTEPYKISKYRYKRIKWNLALQGPQRPSSSKKKSKKEVEKEWLLLGEPTSPTPLQKNNSMKSTILSDTDATDQNSDYCDNDKTNNSESDTSTDIDAIVDEYKQKVKVTSAGPSDIFLHVPSLSSWKITIIMLLLIGLAIGVTLACYHMQFTLSYVVIGYIMILVMSLIMNVIPRLNNNNSTNFNPCFCCNIIFVSVFLISVCIQYSWLAIILWTLGGLMMLLKCEHWCCNCFDETLLFDDELTTNYGQANGVRVPRPPKIIIPLRPHISERS